MNLARLTPPVVRVGAMKRLVLMRHAKTEGHNPEGDRARELLPEGREDAVAVGNQLAELGLQHAMVSTAVRTARPSRRWGWPSLPSSSRCSTPTVLM